MNSDINNPIFISYSRKDKDIVFPFVQKIERELGIKCWIDREGIQSGEQFEEVLASAIDNSQVLIFMLSDNSISSKWTKREVMYADSDNRKIVPVVLDGGQLRKWFKFHFGNVDYIDITEEEQCNKLLNNLASWIGVKRNINDYLTLTPEKIVLKIHGGYAIEFKKDEQKKCYVAEIPVPEILNQLKDYLKDNELNMKKASSIFNLAKDTAVASILGGLILGPLGAFSYMGFKCISNINKQKNTVFEAVLSELNQRYKIHFKKEESSKNDYLVSFDISEVNNIS